MKIFLFIVSVLFSATLTAHPHHYHYPEDRIVRVPVEYVRSNHQSQTVCHSSPGSRSGGYVTFHGRNSSGHLSYRGSNRYTRSCRQVYGAARYYVTFRDPVSFHHRTITTNFIPSFVTVDTLSGRAYVE